MTTTGYLVKVLSDIQAEPGQVKAKVESERVKVVRCGLDDESRIALELWADAASPPQAEEVALDALARFASGEAAGWVVVADGSTVGWGSADTPGT